MQCRSCLTSFVHPKPISRTVTESKGRPSSGKCRFLFLYSLFLSQLLPFPSLLLIIHTTTLIDCHLQLSLLTNTLMASFASVNHHPPFAYDPSCKPTKSILKQKNRLSRTPSSWLSNINSKLQTASLNLSPDGLNEQQQPQQQQQQQRPQTETGTSRPLGLFRKFINNQSNVSDNSSIASGGSNEQQSTTNGSSILDIDELAPEELKRVRFSVGQLTTEYYPYRQRQSSNNSSSSNSSSSGSNDGFHANTTTTIGSDDDEEAPSTASSSDAPELPDHATAALLSPAGNKERHPSAVSSTTPSTSQKKTPKQVLDLYEHACANKEEMPLPTFVASIHVIITPPLKKERYDN